MKFLLVLAVTVGVAIAAEIFRGKPELDDHWKAYKEKHGKQYSHAAHEASRRKNWEKTRAQIEKHNQEAAAGVHSFTMAENHLSDLDDEDKNIMNGARLPEHHRSFLDENVEQVTELRQTLLASVDLRNSTCMPPIENQGQCGSCWAFSASGTLDYALCKKTGKLYTLSEQQLVDCSKAYYNYGCNGGYYDYAWDYVKAAPGQTTLSVYPYTAVSTGTCKYNQTTSVGTVTGYTNVQPKNETAIRTAIANKGAVSAALLVVNSFQYYSSGIYADANCNNGTQINHAVMLVGYGTANLTDYWILRNSWATTWGMKGYMFIKRGVNMCNIEYYVSYPNV